MSLKGGCLCGAVRFSVAIEAPSSCYACHCTDCQTQSGSALGLQMPVFEHLMSIDGDLTTGTRKMPSGANGTIHACSQCLTRIYASNSARPGIIILRAGTLDESKKINPRAHLWVKSKQPWMVIPEEVIIYEEQPETQKEWMTIFGLGE